jgi:hypothetical protein
MKWVELNVGLTDYKHGDYALVTFVKPLIESNLKTIASWHFLWERIPWPELKGKGATLRLRLYGCDKSVNTLRKLVNDKLSELETKEQTIFLGHCFGKHGSCGEEYEGEVKEYGTRGWELIMKMLEQGSEIALELIENREKVGASDEYSADILVYADRHVHLFLNQMSTYINEVDFCLRDAIQRQALSISGKQLPRDRLLRLVKKLKFAIDQEVQRG